MTTELRARLVAETDLTDADEGRIRALLVAAFPQYVEIFTAVSWYAARPDHRLWLEDAEGRMAAHLDFEQRVIGGGDTDVFVAGVGEVATHPDWQGRGVGRLLMAELQRVLRDELPVSFGYLNCREAVAGFYESVGWHRVKQPVRSLDPATHEWRVETDPTMVLPARETVECFPQGLIDLRGMWW